MKIYILDTQSFVINIVEASLEYANQHFMSWRDAELNPYLQIGDKFEVSPANKRKEAYHTMRYKAVDNEVLISWNNLALTVDEANELYWEYAPENNPKADEISELISNAKEYIRSLYPDIETEGDTP